MLLLKEYTDKIQGVMSGKTDSMEIKLQHAYPLLLPNSVEWEKIDKLRRTATSDEKPAQG